VRSIALILFLYFAVEHLGAQDPATFLLPQINYVTINGDTLHHDSLIGKIVFVNFWASWSINSRKHNKLHIKLYERFRQQNLRERTPIVFINVAIDERLEYLKPAIRQDDLHWPYNICDLKGWKSPIVEAYRLKSIPANFIFDAEGKLVNKNVWGNTLDSVLTQLYTTVSN
jgi:thiol-disulfide isomerase/thioredoxin